GGEVMVLEVLEMLGSVFSMLLDQGSATGLQTKLLRYTGIVAFVPNFDDAFCVFNTSMETDFLSNSNGLMDHWLRTVPISGLGQTMNACSMVFAGDIYGDHDVLYARIIGIKRHHNVVRDTLVDICHCSRISVDKEVDIGLDEGRDKPLRPADMLLYSWDGGLDVCVDLTGSSPLTQTGMADFVPSRVVINATQRKRGKYMDKCAANGYGFIPFSFSSLRELEADAVILLNRIRKFSMTQDTRGSAVVHIFNRIGFSIAKGVGVQIDYMSTLEFFVAPILVQERETKGKNGIKEATMRLDLISNSASQAISKGL
ncbi:hypothetical protein Tco_0073984, partial [Tanacetum coccineum]